MNHSFLRNTKGFHKSSKKGRKGMNEFQSIDNFLNSNDDEGDEQDDASAPAPPFGCTSGFKCSNTRMVRVPHRKRTKLQLRAITLVFEQPMTRQGKSWRLLPFKPLYQT